MAVVVKAGACRGQQPLCAPSPFGVILLEMVASPPLDGLDAAMAGAEFAEGALVRYLEAGLAAVSAVGLVATTGC